MKHCQEAIDRRFLCFRVFSKRNNPMRKKHDIRRYAIDKVMHSVGCTREKSENARRRVDR